MKYLLDTNICIHLFRGMDQVAEKIDDKGLDNCCISVITELELLYGIYVAKQKGLSIDDSPLRKFLKAVDIIQLDNSVEYICEERARLRACGTPLEDFDLMIGCTSVSNGLVMVTQNVSHLSRIRGIRIEDWTCQ